LNLELQFNEEHPKVQDIIKKYIQSHKEKLNEQSESY